MKQLVQSFLNRFGYQIIKIQKQPIQQTQRICGPLIDHNDAIDIFQFSCTSQSAHDIKHQFIKKINNKHYFIESFPCSICNGSDFTPIASSKEGFKWGVCADCGLLQCHQRLCNQSLNCFYDSGEYQTICMGNLDDDIHYQLEYQVNALCFTEIFDKLNIPLKSKRILEIGCGSGGILRALHDQGAQVFGFDLDPYRISVGKKFLDSLYVADAMDDKVNLPEKLDYIVLSNILEHLSSPSVFLSQLWKKLKDNSQDFNKIKLLIDVPNLESASDYPGSSFLTFLHIAHLWYFNAITIERLLNNSGFEIEYIFSRNASFTIIAQPILTKKSNVNNAYWNSISSINYANFSHDHQNLKHKAAEKVKSIA